MLVSSQSRLPIDARAFTRTPFAVRVHAVSVWKPISPDVWFELAADADTLLARRRERTHLAGVLAIVMILVLIFGSIGWVMPSESGDIRLYPVIGKSIPWSTSEVTGPGRMTRGGGRWVFEPLHAWVLLAWIVAPSLAGWAMVRCLWIPSVVGGSGRGVAAINFSRHLSSVYLFVYLMILVGSLLLPLMIVVAPQKTEFLRWCLWCFLFGESFFVPAVMWSRLVLTDRDGRVFGRRRYLWLAFYLVMFVGVPIAGMAQQLD